MRILRIAAEADGSRPPIQSWSGELPPDGYAWLPEALDDGRFEAANGFVTVAVDGENTVAAMEENAGARAAWLAEQGDRETAVSPAETMLELLADHEYRLCLLELGAAE
ncbi:hypothetical protein [Dysosmobacter sp.]|uniref:hypothetical protein n=1 Tax=Dysosmobacter sp. TaxID=2591382 RepID=UPI002A8EB0E9|nr:hypothetical protein [Dysosmobacter sp.]MDY3281699.1 hypothetical protein [Dysosmobacter sp.]